MKTERVIHVCHQDIWPIGRVYSRMNGGICVRPDPKSGRAHCGALQHKPFHSSGGSSPSSAHIHIPHPLICLWLRTSLLQPICNYLCLLWQWFLQNCESVPTLASLTIDRLSSPPKPPSSSSHSRTPLAHHLRVLFGVRTRYYIINISLPIRFASSFHLVHSLLRAFRSSFVFKKIN